MKSLGGGILRMRARVFHGGFEVLDCSSDEDKVCAASREQFGDLFAQALRSAGKEDGLACQQQYVWYGWSVLTFPSTGNWFPFQNAKPMISRLSTPASIRTITVAPRSN